jgi:hypothetical protein
MTNGVFWNAALCWKVCSLRSEENECAQVTTCSVGSQGRAGHSSCWGGYLPHNIVIA